MKQRNAVLIAFPEKTDGAKVLYFTDKNDFEVVANVDGMDAECICYLAVCQYNNDTGYYRFLCDEKYEVVTDDLCNSIEQCLKMARYRKDHIIWYNLHRFVYKHGAPRKIEVKRYSHHRQGGILCFPLKKLFFLSKICIC